MTADVRYVEDPFGDGTTVEFGVKRPKWMSPGSDFEKRVLSSLGMQYYPKKEFKGKVMRSRLIEIGRSLVSLESGLVARYPTEWVIAVLHWFMCKRLKGHTALRGFLNSLEDTDWRDRYVREWQAAHHTADYVKPAGDEPQDLMKYLELPKE
jgi:hypothetical protein